MKQISITLISLLFFSLSELAIAQEEAADSVVYQGIEFLDAEWGEILALAELEGKTIFLDAYTSWCRPCKAMDKDVFSRSDIGDFFNGHFLNVKIDMEKGEGIQLAEKYQIIVYPTLLFISYDGSVMHRFAGYKDVAGLFKLGKEALDVNNNLASLKDQYENGDRSADFLYNYLKVSFEAADGQHTKILEEYLATQENWDTDEHRKLIFDLLDTPNSPLFDYIIQNKLAFVRQFGESKVENQIQSLVYYSLNRAEDPLSMIDRLFKKAYPDKAEKLAANYKMNYYREREDQKGFSTAAANYLKNASDIKEEDINDIAWNIYDLVEDKGQLKKLFGSIKQMAKTDTYLNNESLALLYAKLGKKKKAIKLTRKAIAIAKGTKRNSNSSEELIEELKMKGK